MKPSFSIVWIAGPQYSLVFGGFCLLVASFTSLGGICAG